MLDDTLVAKKVAEVRARVERVRAKVPEDLEVYLQDQDLRELVSFNLVLAIQALLDLSAMTVSQEGWGVPETLSGTFTLLAERGVLSADLSRRLAEAAKMRNLVVHRYGAVDDSLVHRAVCERIGDLETACDAILDFLRENP